MNRLLAAIALFVGIGAVGCVPPEPDPISPQVGTGGGESRRDRIYEDSDEIEPEDEDDPGLPTPY